MPRRNWKARRVTKTSGPNRYTVHDFIDENPTPTGRQRHHQDKAETSSEKAPSDDFPRARRRQRGGQ